MSLPLGESPAQRQNNSGRAKARILVALLGLALAAGVLLPSHGASAAVAHAKSDAGSCGSSAHAGNMGSICNNGVSSQSFTYTPGAANDGVLVMVGCAASNTPSAVSLSGSNWTFTEVGGIIGSANSWTALFKAYSPNASQATITQSWTVSGGCTNVGSFMNDLVDEWSGVDATNFVDAQNSGTGSGSCSLNVTPNASNDGIDGFCEDTVTAVGNGYTKGADDTMQDWSEYRVLSASSGVAQTVNFTGGGTWEEFAAAVKPPTSAGVRASSRSDILSNSQLSATSNHTIAFTVNSSIYGSSISGSSSLTLTFPSGFSIPANLDCGDIDVATGSQFNFNWPACQQTATAWGATTTGLVLTLIPPTDTAVHVASGTPITIKIGANATFQQQGIHSG